MPTMRVAMERFKIDHPTLHNVDSHILLYEKFSCICYRRLFFLLHMTQLSFFSGEYILLHININALYLLQRNIVFSFFLLYGALIPNIDHHRPTL